MNNNQNDNDILRILSESLEGLSNLLKSIADIKRLEILKILMKKQTTFSFLLEKIDLKKTSLAHHLSSLIDHGLIDRFERGQYQITEDGRNFIKSIVITYQRSKLKRQLEQDFFKEQFRLERLSERPPKKTERVVSCNPIYQAGWNSYISSVSGILTALGVKYNYIHVGGRSGYSFITNIPKGNTSFLAESMISDNAWEEIQKGTESFGWKIQDYKKKMIYPRTINLRGEDIKLAKEMFDNIKEVINSKDTPVILWGLRVPTYGIIRGYKDDYYLVSTYYRMDGREDTPIKFDQIQALNKFHFFYFIKSESDIDENLIDKNSIIRAINLAKGINVGLEEYETGLKAYDEWVKILENYDSVTFDTFGNSFLGRFYHDAKGVITEYLERMAMIYSNYPQGIPLENASIQYRKVKSLYERFLVVFPYFKYNEKQITKKDLEEGIKILINIQKEESIGITLLEDAIEKWNSINY